MAVEMLRYARTGLARSGAALLIVCALFFAVSGVNAEPSRPATAERAPQETTGFLEFEEPTRLINDYFARTWKAQGLIPAARCDDHEFVRRASLDIIGRIATGAEIERYLKDPPEARRGLLLARLLYADQKSDYARNWANLWTNWLLSRSASPLARRQMQLWLHEAFSTETVATDGRLVPKLHLSHKEFVTQLIAATGRTNDNGAVTFVVTHRGAPLPIAQSAGAFDGTPITSRTIRLFLGYQIQCMQCHDHPLNAGRKQKYFWGVNAFFRQIRVDGLNPGNVQMVAPVLTLSDDPTYNTKGMVNYENQRKATIFVSDAASLDGRRIPAGTTQTRRELLAQFVVEHKNFSPAYVNRMWGQLFGRGLNVSAAYDDMGEPNDLVHPELLSMLADAFTKSAAHDPRKLIQWICSSDVYNLKAVGNATNDGRNRDKFDPAPYFSRMPLKMMTPEQLLESLVVATQLRQPEELRQRWLTTLVRNFGDDEGNETTYTGTILQALLMMNGPDLDEAIRRSDTLAEARKVAANDNAGKKTMDAIFLAAYNRPATPREFELLKPRLRLQGASAEKDLAQAGPLVDLFWALLNSGEFILNH